jgi:two-component system sensor histidine kinase BaeS
VRTLSIAEAGQLPLNLETVDIAGLVESAGAAFAPLAEADGIAMRVQTSAAPLVQGDPARLQQVLANLISNALRYAPQGGAAVPAVSIGVNAVDGAALITVSDNGPGLTDEQKTHVFDRFWRSDAARSRDEGGSGLGLAITRGIVQAHGGDIQVTSTPGVGTTFTVSLPLI